MDWYEVVQGAELEQGDLLLGCPVPRVITAAFPLPDDLEVSSGPVDLAILTQTCDLENDHVDEVLAAAVVSYRDLYGQAEYDKRLEYVKARKFRDAAVRGDLPPYSLLPERATAPAMDWSLVDFHHLYTLPKAYLEQFALGSGERLRLVPPYKEHLAQAFARYMMRVGLPTSLSAFETYKP